MNDLFLRSHTMCRGANAICSAIWELDTGQWGFSDGRQRCLKAPLLLLLILRWWDDWDDETGDARKLMMTMQSKKRGGCSKNKYLPSGMKARDPLKISRTLLVISLSSSPLQMQILGLERAPICTQSSAPLVPRLTILTDGLPHVELITIRLPIQSSTLSSSGPMSSESSTSTSPSPLDASYTISFSNITCAEVNLAKDEVIKILSDPLLVRFGVRGVEGWCQGANVPNDGFGFFQSEILEWRVATGLREKP